MKQIFILLMVAMYATMFTACSKDNETPSPLNSDKEVLTIVVEDETFSFQIESPQLGIIHVNWGDGKQNEYKGKMMICIILKKTYLCTKGGIHCYNQEHRQYRNGYVLL